MTAKLATTMGIELSYVPAVIQTLYDQDVHFDESRENENYSPQEERAVCRGLAQALRLLLDRRGIKHHDCHDDCNCVEVSTNPYRSAEKLINTARKVRIEAERIGLYPSLPYTIGGGAHIHTGIIGRDKKERKAYSCRMFVFAAKNPWLCWAFAHPNDDINSLPLHRECLTDRNTLAESIRLCQQEIEDRINEIVRLQRQLHKNRNKYFIYDNYYLGALAYNRERLIEHKKILRNLKAKVVENNIISLGRIYPTFDKDHVLRLTSYGKHGTIEFRAFEMGDEDQLLRQIKVADAIVRYVSQQTYTEVDINELPTAADLQAMTARDRRRGFVTMLRTLGLRPQDYREESARITARARLERAEQAVSDTTVIRAQARWQRRQRRHSRGLDASS